MTPNTAERHSVDVIPALTGIRAVAAAWVVVEHFRIVLFTLFPTTEVLEPWIGTGYLGVEIFFVLSGLVIAHNYFASMTDPDVTGAVRWRYAANRFARIYPVHLVSVAVLGLMALTATAVGLTLQDPDRFGLPQVLGNVALLQAVPGVSPWNPPAWSISTEFAAYLAFPVLALAVARVRSARLAAGLALAALGAGGLVLVLVGGDPALRVTPTMMWVRIAAEFTAGVLLWRAWALAGRPTGRAGDVLALGSLLLVVVLLGVLGPGDAWPFVTLPLLAGFVLGCAAAVGPVRRVLSSAVLQWGGRVSYSVYMTHFVLLMVAEALLPVPTLVGSSLPIRLAVIAGLYAAVVLVGWLCYRFVEVPGRAWVVRMTTAIPPAHTARQQPALD